MTRSKYGREREPVGEGGTEGGTEGGRREGLKEGGGRVWHWRGSKYVLFPSLMSWQDLGQVHE